MLPKSRNMATDQEGFTLLEMLVSIVILMVGMMGLFQSVNLALDKNLENHFRQQAVAVAEKTLSDQKKLTFDNITACRNVPGASVSGRERVNVGSVFRNMSVAHRVDELAVSGTNTKQISVRVWWRYKNRNYEHQTSSSIGKVDN